MRLELIFSALQAERSNQSASVPHLSWSSSVSFRLLPSIEMENNVYFFQTISLPCEGLIQAGRKSISFISFWRYSLKEVDITTFSRLLLLICHLTDDDVVLQRFLMIHNYCSSELLPYG